MEYSRSERQEFANGVNIVHFPDLTEDERKRNLENLKKATADFMKHVVFEKERKV